MTTKTDPNVFPSLFARLTAESSGFAVQCTATQHPLGFVFWTVSEGVFVSWHYRTPTGEQGLCTTKRGAVQVLRDFATGSPAAWLPFTEARPHTDADAPRAPKAAPAPVAPVAPARRVIWNDDLAAFDVTAAIASGLKGKS